jgi:hypothetical protein
MVGQTPDEAVVPLGHSLRCGVAEDENPGPRVGAWDLTDLFITKAKTVGLELVGIAQPRPNARTVGKKSEGANRIATETESGWTARNRGAKNDLAVEVIEGEETRQANQDGN